MSSNLGWSVTLILFVINFSYGDFMLAQPQTRHLYDPVTSTLPLVYELNSQTNDANVWYYGHTWPAGVKKFGALLMAFKLPELPEGYSIKNAVFHWFYVEAAGTWCGDHDLYGLCYRSAGTDPLVTINDYYVGNTEDTSDATLIQTNITGTSDIKTYNEWHTTDSGSKVLTDYIQTQYANGAKANDWILLRISRRSASKSSAIRHVIKNALDPNFAPYIEYYETQIPDILTYYVSPTAIGNGSGNDPCNAAGYANKSFWDMIKNNIAINDIQVVFADSDLYGSDSISYPALYFVNYGNPLKKLTLSGTSQAGTIWNHTSTSNDQDHFIELEGCQNIEIEKMTFKGNVLKWGVSLAPNSRKPTRNIIIDQCTFKNLTSSYYGALGVSDATRDVWVTNCTFNNVGVGPTAHMIYGSESRNINISGCSFTNCSDAYLKIRKDSDYWTISNSTFTSAASAYDYPFLDICALNSTSDTYDPLDPMEYFGYHIKVNDCSFSAYNSNNGVDAVMFHGMGYDAYDYENNGIRLDAAEGATLESGTISSKRDVMWDNLGIRGGKVVMYNNTFTNIRNRESYVYELAWNSTSAGWVGDADIYDTSTHTVGTELEAVGCIVNGDFEKKGYPSRYWRYNNENTLIPVPHAGLNGTAKAIFLDGSLDSHQIYQWLYNTSTNWQADICFALGAHTGTGEKFLIDIVHNENGDKKVSIGVKDNGQIGIYGGSTFYTLSNLGTISFSVDGNGDGDYSDGGDTLRWYHLRITGNYSSAPFVNVQISDMNSYTLNANKIETNLTRWVNGTPVAGGSTPGAIVFTSTYCDVVLDEVNISSIHPGDCNNDGQNNFLDFVQLASNWMKQGAVLNCDFYKDEKIDIKDLNIFVLHWLEHE
ncbi:MAG: hypothetical protein ABFD79_09020 [Phycisphaerales bacterium]